MNVRVLPQCLHRHCMDEASFSGKNLTSTLLLERKPQAAHVQAAGNETSIEGSRN